MFYDFFILTGKIKIKRKNYRIDKFFAKKTKKNIIDFHDRLKIRLNIQAF